MKKKEQGILTVEASIVLTLFLLFVLFLFSFARMYRAQNMVSHAAMQSADALALESFIREVAHDEDAEEIVKLGNQLSGLTSLSEESFTSLRAADIPRLAKEKFAVAVSSSETNADAVLKNLGIKDGLAGIDFSTSKMDLNNNDVIVNVKYTLKLQFPVFGFSEINVTKAAKAKTFGDIMFEICTVSNDNSKGTASGGGSYKHGTTIEITAEPNYGYYFDGWDDNGDGIVDYDDGDPTTMSKRTVTVTDAKTYTAIFKNKGYAINVDVDPNELEKITVEPAPNNENLYEYGSKVDIAVEHKNSHYDFNGWTGHLSQVKGGVETKLPLPGPTGNLEYTIPHVDGTYHLTANFTPKKYNVTVSVKNEVGGSAHFTGTEKTYDSVEYNKKVSFTAQAVPGYAVDYWMKEGTKIESSDGRNTISDVITDDSDYAVIFKKVIRTVKFYGPNNEVIDSLTMTVIDGQSLQEAGYSLPQPDILDGKAFSNWVGFTESEPITNNDKDVYGIWVPPSITLTATETGGHSITFTAKTEPENLEVVWDYGSSKSKAYYTLSGSGNTRTLTINDDKLSSAGTSYLSKGKNDRFGVTVDGYNHKLLDQYCTVTVSAKLKINQDEIKKIKLTIKPSVVLEHYSYWNKGEKKYHLYYSSMQNLADHNESQGCFHKKLNITYSDYQKAPDKLSKGDYFNGQINEKLGLSKQQGYVKSKTTKQAKAVVYRPDYDGFGYYEVYYPTFNGAKNDNGGYYDYYISAKKNVD